MKLTEIKKFNDKTCLISLIPAKYAIDDLITKVVGKIHYGKYFINITECRFHGHVENWYMLIKHFNGKKDLGVVIEFNKEIIIPKKYAERLIKNIVEVKDEI